MKLKTQATLRRGATKIAYAGVAAATLTAAKFVLSAIPNVEIVTLLTAVYGYVLGLTGLVAVYVFVSVEILLYGMGTWVITYYIHWPFVCLAFMALSRLMKPDRIVSTILAVVLTTLFGVLSSMIDVGLVSGYFTNFFKRFAIYYTRGVYFYIAQIVTNLLVFPTLFKPLVNILSKYTIHSKDAALR